MISEQIDKNWPYTELWIDISSDKIYIIFCLETLEFIVYDKLIYGLGKHGLILAKVIFVYIC